LLALLGAASVTVRGGRRGDRWDDTEPVTIDGGAAKGAQEVAGGVDVGYLEFIAAAYLPFAKEKR
jgi:hypothetical protein